MLGEEALVEMMQVTADVPDALATDLKVDQASLGRELRIAAGLGWFKQRRLSKATAANVAGLSLPDFSRLEEENFFLASWHELRPYAQKLLVDFCITSLLWVVLFAFEKLTSILEIKGWASEFIANVHASGVVVAFSLFAVFVVIDIFKVRRMHP